MKAYSFFGASIESKFSSDVSLFLENIRIMNKECYLVIFFLKHFKKKTLAVKIVLLQISQCHLIDRILKLWVLAIW